MRPRQVCAYPGCPDFAIPGRSRCALHYEPWAGRRGFEGYDSPEYRRNAAATLREEPACRLCGRPSRSVDHIIPKSQGGSDDRSNLRALCRACHKRRSQDQARAGRDCGFA